VSFWLRAEADPDRVALIGTDDAPVTAGALLASANRLVHGLRAIGLQPGDTVAAVLPNGPELIELFLAALQAGWYLTPVNHHFTADEIGYILADSGARAVVVSEAFAEAGHDAAERAGVPPPARFSVGAIDGFTPYQALTEGQPDSTPADRLAGAAMHYTSGTTGRPKGVRRPLPGVSPEVLVAATKGVYAIVGIQPEDGHVHLMTSPMYHTVISYTLTSLHQGHGVVLRSGFDAAGFLDAVARHRVSIVHMVPTMFHRLLSLPDPVRAAADVSSLRYVLHAAAPCPPDTKRRIFDWWGPVLYEYYGATEGGGTVARPEDWLAHPGTVGRPWEGADVRVLDDDGEPCPPGQPGTVWMALGANRFEYHRDEAKTSASRRDGYFTVGDIGYLDDEGWLYLCDRTTDVIISGGVNIYPAEIEAALLSHPAVADAAVIGVPDDEWGEQVKAVVELRPGAPADAAEQLLAHCAQRLARYKLPRSVDVVDALPRDPSGKLFRRHLREPYWAGRVRAI
jgi:long-chain acyl-CoA synthetase